MKKARDAKITRVMHVKRRTKDAYNELSFSVLDERRDRLSAVDEPQEAEFSSGKPCPSSFGKGVRLRWRGKAAERVARSFSEETDSVDSWGEYSGALPETEGLVETRADGGGTAQEDTAGTSDAGETPQILSEGTQGLLLASGVLKSSDSVSGRGLRFEGSGASPSLLPGTIIGGGETRRRAARSRRIGGKASRAKGALPGGLREERHVRRTIVRVFLALIAVVLVLAGGAAAYRSIAGNADGQLELEKALKMLSQTDELVADLDEAIVDPFADGAGDLRASIRGDIEEVRALLADAEDYARTAIEELTDIDEQEVASQVISSVSARLDLLELGEEMMETADRAQEAADYLQEAWNHLISSAELSSAAARVIADTTEENVQTSLEMTQEALEELEEACALLEAAESAFDLDLSAYFDYVEQRETALNAALASDQALLEADAEEALAQNDVYNAADSAAAALAENLPADPAAYVVAAYEDAVAELESAYNAARSLEAAADEAIAAFEEN